MGNQSHSLGGSISYLESFLNALRRYLAKYHFIPLARILRALVHFGPWRVVPQYLIRKSRPVRSTSDEDGASLLGSLNADAIAENIRNNSVAVVGVLPLEFVTRLREITDHLPLNHYELVHHIDSDVLHLSEDPSIRKVLRAYFKCEPVLLESTLVITGSHRDIDHKGQNTFHFDYAGWQSLNVFVYLSDVAADSSCHIVARGSHRAVGFSDVLRGFLTDSEALRRFGSSIQAITGPAGTLFFENTEAFHRRYPGKQRRVMLNLLYASHRSLLSHGRTSNHHINRRARDYQRLQATVR